MDAGKRRGSPPQRPPPQPTNNKTSPKPLPKIHLSPKRASPRTREEVPLKHKHHGNRLEDLGSGDRSRLPPNFVEKETATCVTNSSPQGLECLGGASELPNVWVCG